MVHRAEEGFRHFDNFPKIYPAKLCYIFLGLFYPYFMPLGTLMH